MLALVVCAASTRTALAATPTLDKIGPDLVSVGDPDFTLRVSGETFDKTSVVLLDGAPLQTTFISKKRLHAVVPQQTTNAAGTHTVAVRNGAGETSGTLALTVGARNENITIERINPDTLPVVTLGLSPQIKLSGEGLKSTSKVLLYGRSVDLSDSANGSLTLFVPTEFASVPGLLPVQVKNDNGLSNMVTVPIYDKAATIGSIDPVSVKAGSEAFTLKLSGSGYGQEAVVRINGVDLVPTSIKSQEIKVDVPAAVVAAEAQLPVYVVQSTGLSNVAILRVTPADGSPIVYSISPDRIQAGAGAVKVAVSGANFGEKSKVLVNGDEVKTSFNGRANLTFKLSDSDTDTAGTTYNVQVRNNDGTVTNTVQLRILEPAMVSTVTGDKLDGFRDGGPDEARFRRPSRMAVGSDGLIYVADQLNHAVRRLNPATGLVETLAGDGLPGYVDTGDSTDADFDTPRFNNPLGIAVAANGTIYVSDYGNSVIRRLTPTGSGYTVDTVAGANERIKDKDTREMLHATRRGLGGFQNGEGSVARFRGPDGMAIGPDGTLYVADATNHYIRGIDTTSATFDVRTVAGIGITGFTDGDLSTARFTTPTDVALTPDGEALIVADFNNNRIRRVELATGQVSTVAGSGFEGTDSGSPLFATFRGPIGVAVGADGTIYVTDHFSNLIRVITTDGVTTTLAGGSSKKKAFDGIGPKSRFKDPRGIVYYPTTGDLYVADQGHQRVRKIEP